MFIGNGPEKTLIKADIQRDIDDPRTCQQIVESAFLEGRLGLCDLIGVEVASSDGEIYSVSDDGLVAEVFIPPAE